MLNASYRTDTVEIAELLGMLKWHRIGNLRSALMIGARIGRETQHLHKKQQNARAHLHKMGSNYNCRDFFKVFNSCIELIVSAGLLHG